MKYKFISIGIVLLFFAFILSGCFLFNRPPTVPTNPIPANGATNVSVNPTLQWKCGGSNLKYLVYFGESSDFSTPTAVAENNYTVPSTLNFNSTYYWKVTAKNSLGKKDGPIWSFTTESTPFPAPPENLAAISSSTSVTLKWEYTSGKILSFDLYKSVDNNKNYTLLKKLSPTEKSYVDSDLSTNTLYYYMVKAHNKYGESKSSNIVRVSYKIKDTYMISGYVLDEKQNGIPAVNLFTNQGLNAQTDQSGYYSISSLVGTVTIIASKTNWTFTPSQITLSSATSTANFIGVKNDVPPDKPTLISPTYGETDVSNVTLKWSDSDPNGDAIHYKVYFGVNDTPSLIATNVLNTSYSIKKFDYSKKYYWKIVADDGRGGIATSDTWSFTTRSTPISAPTALKVLSTGQTSVVLSWNDNSSNEAGFEVYRSKDGLYYTLVKKLNANTTTYEDQGLEPSARYYYKVRAYNSYTTSIWSNVINVIPKLKPYAIVSSVKKNGKSGVYDVKMLFNGNSQEAIERAKLSTNSEDETSQYYVTTDVNGYSNQNGLTGSVIITPKKNGWVFSPRSLTVENPSGVTSLDTQSITFTGDQIPSTPTCISPSDGQTSVSTIVTLKWNASDPDGDTLHYDLYYGTNENSLSSIKNLSASEYTLSNLHYLTNYYWRVVANDGKGGVSTSDIWYFTTESTPINAPTELKCTNVTANELTLQWKDNSNNESGFKIYRHTGNTTSYTLLITVGKNTSTYTDGSVTPNTDYWYKVYAYNSYGTSSPSNELHVSSNPDTYSIAGYVKDKNDKGVYNVNIFINNNATVTTDKSGYYSAGGLTGTVTLTSSKDGWTFTPSQITLNSATNNANFTGTKNDLPPYKPTQVSPSNGASNLTKDVTFSWYDEGDPDGDTLTYALFVGKTTTSMNKTLVSTNTQYTMKGLDYSNTYYWKVVADDGRGGLATSDIRSFSTESTPINAPTGLEIGAGGQTCHEIPLTWNDNSDNEDGFEILRSPTGVLNSFTIIATLTKNTTSYIDKGLNAGKRYFYKVRAYNSYTISKYSNTINVMTNTSYDVSGQISDGLNAPIQNVTVKTSNGIYATTDSSGDYEIPSLSGTVTLTASKDGWTFTPSKITLYSATSNANFTGTKNDLPPYIPTLYFPTDKASNLTTDVTFSWNDTDPDEDPLTYTLFVGKTTTSMKTFVSTNTQYTMNGLDYSNTYYWKVVADDGRGGLATSDTRSFSTESTPINAPTGLNVLSSTASSVKIGWVDNSDNEDGFEIERTANGSSTTIRVSANSTTFTDQNVSVNITYTYKVRAYTSYGVSLWSNSVNVTPQADTYSVSGYVKDKVTNKGVNGVTISFSNNYSNVYTYPDGSWSKQNLKGDITITAHKDGWQITPSSTTVNENKTNVNFKAYMLPTIPTNPYPQNGFTNASTSITLKWQCDGDELSYDLHFGASSNPPLKTSDIGTASYTVSNLNYNTTYYWKIIARNEASETQSPIWHFTTGPKPVPPSSPVLNVDSYSTNTITLSWTENSDNVEGFKVYRSTDGKTFSVITEMASNVRRFKDTNLTPNTIYYYQVGASNKFGESKSNVVGQKTKDILPVAPSDLKVTSYSTNTITLSWKDNSNNEDGFKIWRSSNGTDFAEVGTVASNTTSYTDKGLSPNTTYYYEVRAYNAVGTSGFSNVAYQKTKDVPPAAPSDLKVTAYSTNTITLSWTDNSNNEDKFEIWRSSNGADFAEIGTAASNTTSYTDKGLSPNTTYYYKVRAYNAVGTSGFSNVAYQKTKDVPPVAPSDLKVTSYSTSTITLSWTDNSNNEDGFEIWRSSNGTDFAEIGTAASNTTSYTDKGLSPNTTYYYKVRAYNAVGTSGFSNVVHQKTDPLIPAVPLLTISSYSTDTILLSWTESSNDVEGFKIYRSVDGSAFTLLTKTASNIRNFEDKSLTPNVTYYYQVGAYNQQGESKSNVAVATTKLPNEPLLAVKSATITHGSSGIINVLAKEFSNVGGIRVVLKFDPNYISIDKNSGTDGVSLTGPALGGLLIVKFPQADIIDISVAFSNGINISDSKFLQIHLNAASVTGLTQIHFDTKTKVEDINTNPIEFTSYDGELLVE